ncbi:MAG: hypothetical protein R6V54_00225 [Desulfobacteraceae bacterium]
MEAAVQEKFEYLESALGQFIITSNTSLGRLERNISALSREMVAFKNEMRIFKDEMGDFKDEMRGFKDEMLEFKDEMRGFKDEMGDFKDEMLGFKEESKADRKSMNKKWGELANKMGTVVEDIVAPSLAGIARDYFQVDEFDFYAVRLKKRNKDRSVRREFDVVAESSSYFFVVETKATPRTEYIQNFIDFVPEIPSWFPDAGEKTVIPVFASLYLPQDSIQHLTGNKIFAIAMKDDTMDLLNPELLSHHR